MNGALRGGVRLPRGDLRLKVCAGLALGAALLVADGAAGSTESALHQGAGLAALAALHVLVVVVAGCFGGAVVAGAAGLVACLALDASVIAPAAGAGALEALAYGTREQAARLALLLVTVGAGQLAAWQRRALLEARGEVRVTTALADLYFALAAADVRAGFAVAGARLGAELGLPAGALRLDESGLVARELGGPALVDEADEADKADELDGADEGEEAEADEPAARWAESAGADAEGEWAPLVVGGRVYRHIQLHRRFVVREVDAGMGRILLAADVAAASAAERMRRQQEHTAVEIAERTEAWRRTLLTSLSADLWGRTQLDIALRRLRAARRQRFTTLDLTPP